MPLLSVDVCELLPFNVGEHVRFISLQPDRTSRNPIIMSWAKQQMVVCLSARRTTTDRMQSHFIYCAYHKRRINFTWIHFHFRFGFQARVEWLDFAAAVWIHLCLCVREREYLGHSSATYAICTSTENGNGNRFVISIRIHWDKSLA